MNEILETLAAGQGTEMESPERIQQTLDLLESTSPPPVSAILERLPEKGLTLGLHLLLAQAHKAAGEDQEADRVLLSVAERLNQSGFYPAMVRILEPLMQNHPQQVAPLILRARLQGGTEAVDDETLLAAHAAMPKHGVLAWQAAQVFAAQGNRTRAYSAASAALPALIEDKNFEAADEVALFLGEFEDEQTAHAWVESMKILARQPAWVQFDAYLALGLPLFSRPDGSHEAWPLLRESWLKHPDPESLRPHLVEVLRAWLHDFPDPDGVVLNSRINIPSEEPAACLARLDKILAFPPGNYAQHKSWGIGPICENDTESVIIDFPTKPSHRMSLATAERALDVLPPGDVLVLQAHDPESLARLVKEDPEELVVRALQRFPNGEAPADQIRKVLVPAALPSTSWAAWWKRVRPKLEQHSRIDARRAFENTYRLRSPGEQQDIVEVPRWSRDLDVLKNLQLLNTFLDQHPDEQTKVFEAHGDKVKGINTNAREPGGHRVAAALWLERLGETPPVPLDSLADEMDFAPLPKEDQKALVGRVETPEGLAAALNSRLAGIRSEAWDRMVTLGLGKSTVACVLERASRLPDALLALAEQPLPEDAKTPETTKKLMAALFELAEKPPRNALGKRALAVFKPDTCLADLARSHPVSDEGARALTSRLKNWKASDTIRFPLMDFLREVGHGSVSDSVEGHRARAAARLAGRTSEGTDPFDGDLVMSRRSLDRLESERVRIGQELKTTIPQAIQRAREFGDLKENAEYKAAKEKQATYAARFQELESQLRQIRLIENLDRPPGTAFPGTQVELEPVQGGSPWVIWLLGEGDQDLGDNVVSYKAPVGQVLLGAKTGDVLELSQGDGPTRYRVAGIVERLPEAL